VQRGWKVLAKEQLKAVLGEEDMTKMLIPGVKDQSWVKCYMAYSAGLVALVPIWQWPVFE